MSSLVQELQNELLKPSCSILHALRQAHVIASKLKLAEFDTWIRCELNGYDPIDQLSIPDYRKVHGRLLFRNSSRDWTPIQFPNTKTELKVCDKKLNSGISEILSLQNSTTGNFNIIITADQARDYDKSCSPNQPSEYILSINTCYLKSILDKVTTHLLDWTLELQNNGISGDDYNFSESEKGIAANKLNNITCSGNITIINGNIDDSQVIPGNNNSISLNPEGIKDLIGKVKNQLLEENISLVDRSDIEELIEQLDQMVSAQKRPNIIKAFLFALWKILLSIGANVTAGLIVNYLANQGW